MSRHFELELGGLRDELNRMGTLVDDQLSKAYHALFRADLDAALWVIERDREVDAFDNRIEEECLRLFALGQPVAVDLRLLIAALSINAQLERIGDIAVNIAERVDPLLRHTPRLRETRIPEMAEVARIMVRNSLEAFVTGDAALADRVLASDDVVDGLDRMIFTSLVDDMCRHEERVEPGAHMLILCRHLERLADHATNIAEGVIFLVNAKLVKHHAGEDPPGA